MSMIMGFVTVSDANIQRIINDPPLIWQLVAPDDPEPYKKARRSTTRLAGLVARLLRRTDVDPPDLHLGDHESVGSDLDKAWHGIHYLLTGTAWAGSPPLNFLVDGGQTAGDIDVGYGPARLYTSVETQQIQTTLSALTDGELQSRFQPDEMMSFEIYPAIWNRPRAEDDTLGYLVEYIAVLRQYLDVVV